MSLFTRLDAPVGSINKLSIHSKSSINFHKQFLNTDPLTLSWLEHGLKIPLKYYPPRYEEPNNKSAILHMTKLKEIVGEWIDLGTVMEVFSPPRLINPLTMVVETRGDNVKYRPILDHSRCFNKIVDLPKVKLDDLNFSEKWLKPNDFQTSMDLSNMFHHVQLHPSMYEFFGFKLEYNGKVRYFVFKILMYGTSYAVFCVTKLFQSLKAYLHSFSILFTIFIDDMRISHENESILKLQTEFCEACLKASGWTINYKKSELIPNQQIMYLGFYTDTLNFKYFSHIKKLNIIIEMIEKILESPVVKKLELASVLGKIASRKRSHGNIVTIMSRICQHKLGQAVYESGDMNWQGNLILSKDCINELLFFRHNIIDLNGHPIQKSRTPDKIVTEKEKQVYLNNINETEFEKISTLVSDASDHSAFIYDLNDFKYVLDFSFNEEEKLSSSSFRELLSIIKFLEVEKNLKNNLIYWYTDSQNLATFLNRGSKKDYIQKYIFNIKIFEYNLNCKIVPIWVSRYDPMLVVADLGSKICQSTDEWSVSELDYNLICSYFKVNPDIDCFASNNNSKTKTFYSKIPQLNTSGVNFFAQKLNLNSFYWACPPTHLIVDVIKHISKIPVNMLLHIPVWKSSNFWPIVVQNGFFHENIAKVFYIKPFYTPNNHAQNIFNGKKKFFSIIALISPQGKHRIKCEV